jgi:hypothetical protein
MVTSFVAVLSLISIIIVVNLNQVKSSVKNQLNDYNDIDPNSIVREFANEYMKNTKKQQSNDKFINLKQPKITNYIDLHTDFMNISIKSEILNKFLVTKICQFNDQLNLINIPEFKDEVKNLFKIFKYDNKSKREFRKFGSTSCSLETNAILKQSVTICPSHFVS